MTAYQDEEPDVSRYLGKLCVRAHDWRETGRSLRYRANSTCLQCMREKNWGGPVNAHAEARNPLPGLWYSQADIDRFWNKVVVQDGCWDWRGWANVYGYPMIYVSGKDMQASRFSWSIHHDGERLVTEVCVLHKCDNPRCTRPDHLMLGSQADNIADRDAKGRTARGEKAGPHLFPERLPHGTRHHNTKLTDKQVREMRALRDAGVSLGDLASRFGMSKSGVSNIVRGKTWRYLG